MELEINQQPERANEPLELRYKLLYLLFFWGVHTWGTARAYRAQGYLRKHQEAWRSIRIGFMGFVLLLGGMILYLSMTT